MENLLPSTRFRVSDNIQMFEEPQIFSLHPILMTGRVTHTNFLNNGLVRCFASVETSIASSRNYRMVKSFNLGEVSIMTEDFDGFEWEVPLVGSDFQAVSLGTGISKSGIQNYFYGKPGRLKVVEIDKANEGNLVGRVIFYDGTEIPFYRSREDLGDCLMVISRAGKTYFVQYLCNYKEYFLRVVKSIQRMVW